MNVFSIKIYTELEKVILFSSINTGYFRNVETSNYFVNIIKQSTNSVGRKDSPLAYFTYNLLFMLLGRMDVDAESDYIIMAV